MHENRCSLCTPYESKYGYKIIRVHRDDKQAERDVHK